MEELQVRHRKEQRDLQSQITQKKKQASKKTRKGVNEECDRLESELKERQQAEIATSNGQTVDTENVGEDLENLRLHVDEENVTTITNGEQQNGIHSARNELLPTVDSGEYTSVKRPNRQKARLARRAAEQEEQARQAAEEAKNLPDLKQQERERMLNSIKERGLQEKEIRADGHCLYSAVADQLEHLQILLGTAPNDKPTINYKVVRKVAADYIEEHQDTFAPFLDEPLPDYLRKIRDTGEWGGQLELMALAKSYDTNINVLQDFDRVEKVESDTGKIDRVMWLSYYKHGFGLGEHYNSLRKAP